MRIGRGGVAGVGLRAWTVPVPDAPALVERLHRWPRTATDRTSDVVIRHRQDRYGDYLSSSLWGSMVLPSFEHFHVRAQGPQLVTVEQRVAPAFAVLAWIMLITTAVLVIVGIVAAVHGTVGGLIALVGPVAVRVAWIETTRTSAAGDFAKFLQSTPEPITKSLVQ